MGFRDNNRVLAIMPHPDDIEILCAGTLLRLRDAGCEIHLATMTAGDKGSATLSREEIATIRREEARRASEVLGAASYCCLEFADLEIIFDNRSRRRVTALVREIHPFLVFTTPPEDYMFDHEITSRLVRDACFNAICPLYETDGGRPPLANLPYLYYSDAVGGHNLLGRPSRVMSFVDISDQIERKAEALACHDSQRSWLQKQHGIDDYIESMKRWAADRGRALGADYVEAFCQHLGHPHRQDDILVELVGAVSRRKEVDAAEKK